MPRDAEGPELTAVVARRQGREIGVAAHEVRWGRTVAGLPVRGTLTEHRIAVVVTQGRVTSYRRLWPALSVGRAPSDPVLAVSQALRIAAPEVAAMVGHGPLTVTEVEPVLGCAGGTELVLGYAFRLADGAGFVVDARSGHLLL